VHIAERERKTHTLNHFLTLSQAHERPERREVRENAFWKRREVVVVKTKHAESRTEGESGLKLEILSCTRTLVKHEYAYNFTERRDYEIHNASKQ
jgi:hypothetical protein